MEIYMLLEYIGSLNEEQKEQAINEEFERQKKYVDTMCEIKRIHSKENL